MCCCWPLLYLMGIRTVRGKNRVVTKILGGANDAICEDSGSERDSEDSGRHSDNAFDFHHEKDEEEVFVTSQKFKSLREAKEREETSDTESTLRNDSVQSEMVDTPKDDAPVFGDVNGKPVSYPSDHPLGDASGFMYSSRACQPRGMIVIHEWWGVNDFVRETATRIMKECACVVVAADVFRGHVFSDPKLARANMMSWDHHKAALDVGAAAAHLRSLGCRKVGVIGFGFGAPLSLVSAATYPKLFDAAVSYCGTARDEFADFCTKIRCPVQGHYAARDKVAGVSSPADYNAMADKLWTAKVPLEMRIYNAEHAFSNREYPTYNEAATGDFYENLNFFIETYLDGYSSLNRKRNLQHAT